MGYGRGHNRSLHSLITAVERSRSGYQVAGALEGQG